MKTTTRMLVLAASLTLLLALVATANAKPTTCKGSNPACTTTTIAPTTSTTTTVVPGSLGVGLSCEDYAALNPGSVEPLAWNTEAGESQFPSGEEPLLVTSGEVAPCIDFRSTTAGSFTVTVTSVEPEAKRNSVLATVVKDSHPGDHCGAVADDSERSALNLNLRNESSGTIGDVPTATLNACGTRFAEAELQGNEVVNPTTAQDGTPDPLAIMFLITGKPDITANITLHFKPVGSQ